MIYDVCIIGGGAAGLMAAACLVKNNLSVLIIEGRESCANKLKLTGNGRANLTNKSMDPSCYYCDDRSFINSILKRINVKELLEKFEELQLDTEDIDGYYYPKDFSSVSVINALFLPYKEDNLMIFYKKKVREIKSDNNIFILYGDKVDGKDYREELGKAKYVLLAAGGASYPKTGSDGSGLKLAEKLSIKCNRFKPGLVPLICNDKDFSLLKGQRDSGKITLYIDDNMAADSEGEIQYTEDGISGIPTFQFSRIAVKAVDEGRNVYVNIDHLPDIKTDTLKEKLYKRFIDNDYDIDCETALNSLVPEKIIDYLFKKISINKRKKSNLISQDEFNRLLSIIKNDKIEIKGYKGFDRAQVSAGGIDPTEIDVETMEIKQVPGLFAAGEIIDCDGICGGYNLHFAFATAMIAAEGISLKNATDKSDKN